MSLNTAHAQNGVLLYSGEFILLYCDGVQLAFEGRDAETFKGEKKGRIYLTTHRMIFRNNELKSNLQSFSFPFHTISGLSLEQPTFGANYIKGCVKAEPNGNWTGACEFKMKFKSGGAIEFGQAMMLAGQAASRFMGQAPPPPYSPPQGPYFQSQAYMAPAGPAPYGFAVPTHVFPEQPAANSVYMTEMPPPYPGVMGVSQQPSTNTAYVDPQNAGFAYAPQQQQAYPAGYAQQPPAYGQGQPNGYPQGYPMQQAGYPAQQMAYPQGYPTQQQVAYPQNGYPQQPGYPAASGYPPQQEQYMGPPPPYYTEQKKNN